MWLDTFFLVILMPLNCYFGMYHEVSRNKNKMKSEKGQEKFYSWGRLAKEKVSNTEM